MLDATHLDCNRWVKQAFRAALYWHHRIDSFPLHTYTHSLMAHKGSLLSINTQATEKSRRRKQCHNCAETSHQTRMKLHVRKEREATLVWNQLANRFLMVYSIPVPTDDLKRGGWQMTISLCVGRGWFFWMLWLFNGEPVTLMRSVGCFFFFEWLQSY